MKMNLSVVMGIIDKVSAPLKGMSSESDYYAKEIKKVQQAQADDASALTMIASIQKMEKEQDKNSRELDEAAEKLAKLKTQMAATENPSAALTNKLAKQTEKLALLTAKDEQYAQSLSSTGKRMKKMGVDVSQLDNEFDRLSRSQQHSAKSVDAMSLKYKKLQRAMAPINRLSSAIKMPQIRTAAMSKGVALLSGFTLAGLFNEVNSTAAEMDKLSKTAKNLNMPVEELQAMQSQSEHAGVSADTMSAAIGRFTKRLGVLQTTGAGAMGAFLKKGENPLYEELQNAQDTQQAYDQLLNSFSALKTNQEQMAFADAAFGGDGRKMLLMLREGSQGLSDARDAFNRVGGGVKSEDAEKAEAYNDALQKVQESIKAIKFSALAPIMERMTGAFTEFSTQFENEKWRTEKIDSIKNAVIGLYEGFIFIGKVLLFVKENFAGVIATLLLFKAAMIAVNAVIMLNPIGLMVAAALAAVVAIGYLIEKVIGLDVIINGLGDMIGWLWKKIKSMISMLPDALVPDGWAESLKSTGEEADKLKSKLGQIKGADIALKSKTTERWDRVSNDEGWGGFAPKIAKPMSTMAPLTNHAIKSQAEVAVTIKSEKPVKVDKVKAGQGMLIKLNTGNMAPSF